MEINPRNLYKDYTKKIIDKDSLIKQLIALIENSRNIHIRIQSIRIIGQLDLSSNDYLIKPSKLYHILENLLISDSNDQIRNEAAILLNKYYKKISLSPMKWALLHDESPECLKTIHASLIEIIGELERSNDEETVSILKNELFSIDDKDFKINIHQYITFGNKKFLTKSKITEILINFFTIVYLRKIFWRLKYRVINSRVVELDFSFKVLTKLPEALKFLKSLKRLTLKYNQILEIPDWIGELTSLEYLNLNINNVPKLPNSFSNLHHLNELLLWKNELETLPEGIGNLTQLRKLNLRLNQIKKLPNTLTNLSNLVELDLHDNRLQILPESITLLKSLEKLNLSWNILHELPDSIQYLSSLKILDIERNELRSIPSSFGNLSSLEVLNLSENQLVELPETIGRLNSLRILNLSRNELKYLPHTLSSLQLLEELYLVDNPLEEIPSTLRKLEDNGLKIFI